jgi:hypothetical protein
MPRPARKSAICCSDKALIDLLSRPPYGCCDCADEGPAAAASAIKTKPKADSCLLSSPALFET